MTSEIKIDIVYLWVDDQDKKWRTERKIHERTISQQVRI